MKTLIILFVFFLAALSNGFSQSTDTSKSIKKISARHYFIITAGEKISAYYNDKPLSVETISEFDEYVQHNAKVLKDAQVVVTGKPKTGTYDEVLKTLSHYRIKNVTKNILTN
jgi:hypothetical protein